MSVLTHVLKRRRQWHHICEITARNRRAQANFDWLFYVAAAVLVFMYRAEVIGFIIRFLEGL